MSREIVLTQGQVAIVDDEDYENLNQWKWYAIQNRTKDGWYARRNSGKFPFRKNIKMHRYIMNTPENMECDHINHDTLDNRKSNLRNVTHHQNVMNSKIRKDNKTGYKGVYLFKGKIKAHIRVGGKNVHLGTFETLEKASEAYENKAKEVFGKYKS